jgi:hypothetical protein
MAGESILLFVPFCLSAVDWLPAMYDWVQSWAGEKEPDDWFEQGHDWLE